MRERMGGREEGASERERDQEGRVLGREAGRQELTHTHTHGERENYDPPHTAPLASTHPHTPTPPPTHPHTQATAHPHTHTPTHRQG